MWLGALGAKVLYGLHLFKSHGLLVVYVNCVMLTTNIIFPRDEGCLIFMFTIRTKLVFDRLNSPTRHTLHTIFLRVTF